MKKSLIKVKMSQNNNRKCESDTYESESVKNMTVEKTHQNRSTNENKVREVIKKSAFWLSTWVERRIGTILMDGVVLVEA